MVIGVVVHTSWLCRRRRLRLFRDGGHDMTTDRSKSSKISFTRPANEIHGGSKKQQQSAESQEEEPPPHTVRKRTTWHIHMLMLPDFRANKQYHHHLAVFFGCWWGAREDSFRVAAVRISVCAIKLSQTALHKPLKLSQFVANDRAWTPPCRQSKSVITFYTANCFVER